MSTLVETVGSALSARHRLKKLVTTEGQTRELLALVSPLDLLTIQKCK